MTAETADVPETTRVHTRSFLDSVWMRLIALAIAVGGVALFIVANPDLVTRVAAGGSAGSTAYQQCLDERMAAVAELAGEAGYTAKQKELAEIRAREYCRNQAGM